jgi:hypothetical protein
VYEHFVVFDQDARELEQKIRGRLECCCVHVALLEHLVSDCGPSQELESGFGWRGEHFQDFASSVGSPLPWPQPGPDCLGRYHVEVWPVCAPIYFAYFQKV